PPVPDRHQLRHPALVLLQQQPDRIPRPIRAELRLRLQRSRCPGVFPPRLPVRPAQLFPRLLPRPGPRPAPTRCPRGRLSSPRPLLRLHRHGTPARRGPPARSPELQGPAWFLASLYSVLLGSPLAGSFTSRSPSGHHSTARRG